MNKDNRIGGYRAGKSNTDAKRKSTKKYEDTALPKVVDLRKYMTPVEEQVGNSCVANAFAGAYEYLAKRTLGDSGDVSRLFIYYNARYMEETQEEDCGSVMAHAIEGLKNYGACAEDVWPNNQEMITEEPPEEAYEHASQFTIEEAEFIETDLDLWRHTLAEGYPIAFALNTFDSFDEATRNRGKVPMPKKSDNIRETHGWHAMLCVGYSDKDRMFIVRNSWGNSWGDEGYCYIPYDYVIHPEYNGHDSWIIKSVSDLEFTKDIWYEDEENSYLADENAILLYDFYIETEEAEDFAVALEELCLEYVENEEDFYFDYEYEDTTLNINNFEIITESIDDFLADLEQLCEEYAIEGAYDFSYEANEEEE
ncbi:MAG: C1 family peptidase [Thermonemataceae bacterium]|nr:C1 family peptidase [Thermonemataceae bacterium]